MENIIASILIAAVPLLLATVGEIVTERSGILNLGAEGIMAAGAVFAYAAASASGSLAIGIAAGVLAAVAMAGLHALASITFRANQTVSGLAITMLGLGLAGLLGKPYIGTPATVHSHAWRVPGLGDIPFVGTIVNSLDGFFYAALLLTAGAWFFLNHTRGGLRLKTCGENPRAAEALGIAVGRTRFLATLAGGAFFGLAGCFLCLSFFSSWNEAVTGGRGWIAVALTIFALWRPWRALVGAVLFGGIFVLQYNLQPLGIPSNVLGMLPYLTTLLVLVVGGLRSDRRLLSAPAALGETFRPGER